MAKKNGAKPQDGWHNRIVGYGEEDPESLLANSSNWRGHPKNQQDALLGVLHEVGVVQNILVNRQSGMVVDGHLRVALALREGQKSIPITYVDLSPDEEALILATLDPLSALAFADKVKLGELLADVSTTEAALQRMLAELAVKTGVTPPNDPLEEWQGMPEFEHEDLTAYKSLIVHFKAQEDVDAFSELVEQRLTEKTKAIWYPEQERIRYGEAHEP